MISGQYFKSVKICSVRAVASIALVASFTTCVPVHAQTGLFGNRVGVVGGISIDAQGAVRSATALDQSGALNNLRATVGTPGAELTDATQLRMVSLRKLQAEIAKSISEGKPLGEEVLFLAGLQRVQYVFAYPEQNDIVLAGPAEGWVVREDATVVGKTSGRPVLQLEDLITALRTSSATQKQAITVSIDPTPEGELRLNRLLGQIRTGSGFDPRRVEPAMKEAFGPQMVSLATVASDSRMAQTLVAADYRMKRLAMNLEDSPVAGLPSYMEMIRDGGASAGVQPRWWMACDYDAILHSEDMLAWKLTGRGIKAMTENEMVDESGARAGTGKTNKQAQKWADMFTEKFDDLCIHNAAFGDLRNVMDLNIVATVIQGHELQNVAGCDLALLCGTVGDLSTPKWQTPKTISPECSFVRGRAGWTISASGGVEINPWRVVSEQAKSDDSVKTTYIKANSSADHWWWN